MAEAFFNSDYFCPLDRSAKGKQAREVCRLQSPVLSLRSFFTPWLLLLLPPTS